jgi:hypothetical protein
MVLHGRRKLFQDTYLDDLKDSPDADFIVRGINELNVRPASVPYNRAIFRETQFGLQRPA